MLIWLDFGRKIIACNEIISREEAVKYMDDLTLWIEGLKINKPSCSENQMVDMYLNLDNTIRYDVVNLPPKPISLEDVNSEMAQVKSITSNTETTVTVSADDVLTTMEIQLQNQEMLNRILVHLGLK